MKLLSKKTSANLPAPTKTFRSKETVELVELYNNIEKLTDPTEQILLLGQFQTKANEVSNNEASARSLVIQGWQKTAILTVLGSSVLCLFMGSLLFYAIAVCSQLLFIGGTLTLLTAELVKAGSYDRRFLDLETCDSLTEKAKALSLKLQEGDIRQLARSPHSRELFSKFPRLKEAFMLECSYDNLTEETRPALGLEKTAPEKLAIRI